MGTPGFPLGLRSPFSLDDEDCWRRWRDWKLAHAPASVEDLVVEVRDPRRLRPPERAAIVDRCARANMAIYASRLVEPDKDIPRLLGEQLGLRRLDANWLADEDGISSIAVRDGSLRGDFIPYTNRPIRWHTDGYYNPPERRIDAMLLHCARQADSGGENRLMDHEIAYLLLREESPEHVRALSRPDAMLIPAREADADGAARPAQAGPVFSLRPESGDLHMRYTARTRSIEWNEDPAVQAAVSALARILEAPGHFAIHARMSPGMGLVCNNVLHDRTGFTDSEANRRLVFRARYLDRIAGTGSSFAAAARPE